MTGSARILVVDDQPNIVDMLATVLTFHGFTVDTAGTATAAVELASAHRPDLVLLDVMLPDGDGMRVCRRLRADGFDGGVVFLTARDARSDLVTGLANGGDDYVTKPFSIEELVARIRAVLRRTHRGGPHDARLAFADLAIDENAYEVTRGGEPVELTPTEYKLLRYLMLNAGRVLTKRQILEHVWEYDFAGNDAVVQTYISYLRRKVDNREPALIHTVPRVGYILRLPRPVP